MSKKESTFSKNEFSNLQFLKIENKQIIDFYNEHPSIDFEKANLLLIEFLDKIFNHVTDDLDTNINSQILAHLLSSKKEMETLRQSVQDMKEKMSTNAFETVQNINTQLGEIKKEYINEMQSLITNGNITTSDKISTFIDRNNQHILDRTTVVLNDIIPKTQDVLQSRIRDNIESKVKELYTQMTLYTDNVIKSSSGEQGVQDFINKFDLKYNSMLQNIQSPLFSYVSASEERITTNINAIKELSSNSISSQNVVQEELKQFLSKYNASSNKGKYGENNLYSILTSLYPSSDIMDTTGMKASGDFILKRLDKPNILLENKDYSHNINKDEVSKFIRDIDTQNMNGIFISQYSGISFKNNYHIDIHKGNILIYIQHCEYSPDKIRIAVDIIDYLSSKVQELNLGETNNIPKELLDDINDEYQNFILQKESLTTTLKDFQKKMNAQIDAIKLPSLDKYLVTKYAHVQNRNFLCNICNNFVGSNKQSLSAHQRGCRKKFQTTIQNTQIETVQESV
tara:strand:+ start:294 stop:1829 length:1536 start_codon:yes stop_codon:yes gene_type:complete